ncbi:ketoacyl-ACP synthase III family protein [Hydrogenophaga sp.]|uniref:ketoacyl-ACP synthase III family protein n=1 Tax=Hydrogenophaga sp. TaxID=1904254 RepID=UPI00391C41E5
MPGIAILDLAAVVPSQRLGRDEMLAAHPGEADRLGQTGYTSAAIEPRFTAGELALQAVRGLRHWADDRLRWLMHTSIHDQGMGVFWNPAVALQAELGLPGALPLALRQGCDGLLVAFDLAVRQLQANPGQRALLVGSDRFAGTGFCRVTSDYGIVYGDGAAAVVLGQGPGLARVVAVHTVTDPGLASLHHNPGPDAFDVRAAKRQFLAEHGQHRLRNATRAALMALKQQMVGHLRPQALRHVLVPHLGCDLLRDNYFSVFEGAEPLCPLALGLSLGHLGTTDQLVALHHLMASGAAKPGEQALLIGAGAGFSWTAVLLELQAPPPSPPFR